jgi:hypothetical protein
MSHWYRSGIRHWINVHFHLIVSSGPTLLFQRYLKQSIGEDASIQKFYACSACRDRKDCNFFQPVGEIVSEAKMKVREDFNRQSQPPYSHKEYYKRFAFL